MSQSDHRYIRRDWMRGVQRGRVSRRLAVGLMVGLIAAAVAGSGSSTATASSAATYKIGVDAGLTGYLAPFDPTATNALKMAAQQVNAQGGIGGKYKITVEVKNSNSDIGQTVEVAKQLIASGVDFLATPCDIDPAIAAGKVAQVAHIPNVSLCSTGTQIPRAAGNYAFSAFPSEIAEGTAQADYVWNEMKLRTAYTLISTGTLWTRTLPVVFKDRYQALGGRVVGTGYWDFGQTNFSALISQIVAAHPAVIETNMYEPEFPAFIRQLRSSGVTIPIMESNSVDTPTVLALGSPVQGLIFTTPVYAAPHSKLGQFYSLYQKKYHQPANVGTSFGYDMIKSIIVPAVEAAGTTNPVAVRNAIANLADVPTVTGGTLTFRNQGNVAKLNMYIVRVENGAVHLVKQVAPINNPRTPPPGDV